MTFFVHFNLKGQRFHLLLPYPALTFDFNEMDMYLKLIIGAELHEQTRQLKLTQDQCEPTSQDWHQWAKQIR